MASQESFKSSPNRLPLLRPIPGRRMEKSQGKAITPQPSAWDTGHFAGWLTMATSGQRRQSRRGLNLSSVTPRSFFWTALILAAVSACLILHWLFNKYEQDQLNKLPWLVSQAHIPGIAYAIAEANCRTWTRYRTSSAFELPL